MMMGPSSLPMAVILNESGAEINVHAKNSYAFQVDGSDGGARYVLINRGKVNLRCGDGSCATFKPGTEKYDQSEKYPNLVLFERLKAEIAAAAARTVLPAKVSGPGTPLPAQTGELDLHGNELRIRAGGAQIHTGRLLNGTLTVPEALLFLNKGSVDGIGLTVAGELRNAGMMNVNRQSGVTGLFLNRQQGVVGLSGAGSLGFAHDGSFINYGTVTAGNATVGNDGRNPVIYLRHGATDSTGRSLNSGTLKASGGYGVMESHGDSMKSSDFKIDRRHVFVNKGTIEFAAAGGVRRALHVKTGHRGHDLLNDGTITVRGNGAVAMYSDSDSQMVNNGTINLGEENGSGNGAGQVAMELGEQGHSTAHIVNTPKGVINIFSDDSYAFQMAPRRNAFLMNMGQVNVRCPSKRCGLFKGDTAGSDRSEFYSRIRYHANLAAEMAGTRGEIADSDQLPGMSEPPQDGNALPAWDNSHRQRTGLPGGVWLVDNRGQTQTHDGALDSGKVKIVAGTLINTGRMELSSLTIDSDGSHEPAGFFSNRGSLSLKEPSAVDGVLTNEEHGLIRLGSRASIAPWRNGSLVNHGLIMAMNVAAGDHAHAIYRNGWSFGRGQALNTGKLVADGGYGVMRTTANMPADTPRNLFVNRGEILFSSANGTVNAFYVKLGHEGHDILNDGAILVLGNNAVAMRSDADSQLVNRGVITLGGVNSTDRGMVAMMLGPRASPQAAIVNEGTIRIHAKNSHAFQLQGKGKLINRGQIFLRCGTDGGCAIFKDEHTRQNDKSATPEAGGLVYQPRMAEAMKREVPERFTLSRQRQAPLKNYQISTTASGGAGTLSADNLYLGDVAIDTRFSAGTSARQVVFDKVFVGKDLAGAGNIQATTPVWRAHGHYDADGHIGVTLVKNDYRELITDASLAPVAEALERSYTSNALFRSLELPERDAFTRALRQLSGAGLERPLRATATLAHRFGLMADTVAEDETGFGFALLGRGQPGSRLGASTYDMVALQQRFGSGTSQLAVRYGFARLSPDGKDRGTALDGHSQFLSARHVRPLLSGLALESETGYALHQYRTQRTLRYGDPLDRHDRKDANRQLQASHRRDLLGSQVNLALTRTVGSVVLEPLLGVKLRYQRDGALRERQGGDFGLRLSSRHQAALDGVLGLRLSHDGRDGKSRGWRLDAQFHARPALLRHTGQREASLAGAPDARFALAPGRSSRFSHDSRLGIRHEGRHSQFSLNGYLGRNDGELDRGMTANWLYRF